MCKISFDTIPLIRWCNPLVFFSPMHYGNPNMQASRHGHVFIHASARVYAHTRLFACLAETNEHLQLEVFGVKQYCILRYSLTSVLCVLYNKFVQSN